MTFFLDTFDVSLVLRDYHLLLFIMLLVPFVTLFNFWILMVATHSLLAFLNKNEETFISLYLALISCRAPRWVNGVLRVWYYNLHFICSTHFFSISPANKLVTGLYNHAKTNKVHVNGKWQTRNETNDSSQTLVSSRCRSQIYKQVLWMLKVTHVGLMVELAPVLKIYSCF